MALYHGWDREPMLSGAADSDASKNMPGTSLSSFTPVNASRAPVQFVNPQRTLNQLELDDITAQHTLEATPERPVQKGKKKRASHANEGRAVSIGRVWEYRDEGDVAGQNQGANFESSFPKRRKSAPAKRTKSALRLPNEPSQIQKKIGPDASPVQDSKQHLQEEGSHLTTPPDSKTRATKKVAHKPRKANVKIGPFRNPVITKPSVPQETCSDEDVVLVKPVTIIQGWTSTQEAVKHKFNGISKTTLDKLAAFRYKPSAEAQMDDPSSTGGVQEVRSTFGQVAGSLVSSDYGSPPRGDPVFDEVYPVNQDHAEHAIFKEGYQAGRDHTDPTEYHITQSQQARWTSDQVQGDDVFFSDAIWNVMGGSVVEENSFSSQTRVPTEYAMGLPQTIHRRVPDPFSASASIPQLSASHAFQAPQTVPEILQATSDYGDPSSSEMRELAGVAADIDHTGQYNEYGALGVVHPWEDLEIQAAAEKTHEYYPNARCSQHLNLGGLHVASHEIETDDSLQLPVHHPGATEIGHVEPPRSMYLVDVQVGRSHINEPQTTPRDISKDFEFDEFDDEGVDDADLLAFPSDAAIPETQPLSVDMANGRPDNGSSDASPIVGSNANLPTMTVMGDEYPSRDEVPASPEILSEDEFPMEDGLEEDLQSLPTHLQVVVIETFEAPPSLEYSFANGPMSGEVYDKSLQFSPPKSRPSSVLPSNAAGGSVTDGQSPSKIQSVIDLGSNPEEEEDWSFIRSNDSVANVEAPITLYPLSDQEHATPDKAAKQIMPLGPQKQRKRHAYTKFHTVTQPSTSHEFVLDDSHEYEPLQPFARPDFPSVVLDRCPVIGVSAQTCLRVCFRVGEMFREGARCNALKQDAIMELFARVTFSSREPETTKQHFQFADLWHDRPPFPNGVLANYKPSGLTESESRAFIGAEEHLMARCIGRLRRDTKNSAGWFFDIINIRPTDWEEVKWTKRIVSAGLVKSVEGAI